MTISTYSELKSAIIAWLDRADLSDYVGDFIALAEDHFNRSISHRKMVAITDLPSLSGVCDLPDDYLQYRRVVEKAAQRRELSFITPEYADQNYPSRHSGLALNFSIIGQNLYTFPFSENDIELTYVQKIPALSDASPSNWLLQEAPSLYLRASQVMALEFINEMNSPRYASMVAMTSRIIDDMNAQSELSLYAKAPMRAARVTP